MYMQCNMIIVRFHQTDTVKKYIDNSSDALNQPCAVQLNHHNWEIAGMSLSQILITGWAWSL